MPDRLVILDRARPHELLMLLVGLIIGTAYLFGAPPPGSIVALMPTWQIHTWSAVLVASGVVGLTGALWPQYAERAMAAEAAGMYLGASGAALYGGCLVFAGGGRALLAGGLALAWVLANLWRARQIARDLAGLEP